MQATGYPVMLAVREIPSPSFNQRDPAATLRYIVLHYTGTKTAGAWLEAACNPETGLSAHYMVDEDGGMVRLVDEGMRAWHAGQSFWRGVTDLNSASIGIELANPGHQNGYRPFPAAQISALKELLRDIVRRRELDAEALLAHSDIAPLRKEDPGELFPWKELAEEGLGLWPEPQAADYGAIGGGEAAELLRAIGYDCPDDADAKARGALLAFQRHYRPENLNGAPDKETAARLRALKNLLTAEAVPPAG